ncbi:S8 family peptidase [Nonomuraea sediminis]|uniref:S8 family peptidase n=1 Tax=Nonomuraea sediminis TaxID=2835864 RepID=UPI001BDC0E3C|nr:S8 family serine peptidase [Nonomuraea sediminis]
MALGQIRKILASATTVVALGAGFLAGAPGATAQTGSASTYLVLYSAGASTDGAKSAVEGAGGSLVASYSQIGVAVASSSDAGFATAMEQVKGVEAVAATTKFGTKVDTLDAGSDNAPAAIPAATWGDSLSGLQWDMKQINVPQAHAVTAGSKAVTVADLDTGLDFTHPDLAPVYDAAKSADCSSGKPTTLQPGNDANGHGTHTAGTIAAAANGHGIVGVAPGVKLAGVKTANDDGFFFPEMVICAYMWVADKGIDITNNSYFADPWLFNCANDEGQRAIWKAERRAIAYAQSKGTLVIASEGNESTDLSHPRIDVTSPDFPDGAAERREITNACRVVPVEVPGVVGVTATGNLRQKAYYSSYGTSTADVAAPGGDAILQRTADAVNGRVLSTYPKGRPCARPVVDPATGGTYCYLQGTSMAGPHAVGVAALLLSANPSLSGGSLAAKLQQATNSLTCPTDVSAYEPFPQSDDSPQSCQGGAGHNSWYGSGEIDALKAVS